MFKVPNENRLRKNPLLGSDDSYGCNGFFVFKQEGYEINCMASDGGGWEHVSVTINRNRCPSWEIMCYVKNVFWDEDDTVIQFHPPENENVNYHPYCLHLWRQKNKKIDLPPSIFVGPK